MNFVQNLEECLRDLATACRQKHPGVKEASERAIQRLRTLQTSYIRAVRSADSPDTSLFRSSDLLHPFLLAANYPTADYRLLEIAFKAMRLLMEADAVVPSDAIHVIRVYQIQAQVVSAYYQKQYKNMPNTNNSNERSSSNQKPNSDGAKGAAAGSSSGSWFSWGGGGGGGNSNGSSAADQSLSRSRSDGSSNDPLSTSNATKKIKNAVSSSTGQTGYKHHHQSSQMERLALEILSSLLQLLEMFPSTPDVWRAAVALGALWLSVVPTHHTVYEAAQTTVSQIMSLLLIQTTSGKNSKDHAFLENSVEDLLLAVGQSKKKGDGVFGLCKEPIPIELALELLKSVLAVNPSILLDNEGLLLKTLGVTKQALEKRQHFKTAVSWTVVLLPAVTEPELFEELLETLVQPISAASASVTDEFEDGYVYDEEAANSKDAISDNLHMDATALGHAALVLEQLPTIVGRCRSRRSSLAESLSDFMTLATSCRDHIRHVAQFAVDDDPTQQALQKPSALTVAVQCGLETMLQLTDEFSPCLAVFQHILKRFVGSKDLCETALKGYVLLVESNVDTNALQLQVTLQSMAKLSITTDSVRDMRCLLCLLKIIHRTKDHLDAAWLVELGRLEMKVQDSASLAVAAVYSRVPQLTTCLSDASVVKFANSLTEILLQEDWSLVTAASNTNNSSVNRGSSNRNRSRTGTYRDERKKLYSQDYQENVLRRASALRNVSQIPVSLMLLGDVVVANLFRDAHVAAELMALLSSLSLPGLQPFCMDLLTSILMYKLSRTPSSLTSLCRGPGKLVFENDPMLSQLWAVEPIDEHFELDSSSQLQVLSPLCDSLSKSSDVSTAKASLEVLNTILEGTGQTLRGEVWIAVIEAIGTLSGDGSRKLNVDRTGSDWSSNCLMAFGTLKLIVDDFRDLATYSSDSNGALLDACSAFAASRHDINTSLTAIGLLWKIADMDSAKASISQLVSLGCDERPEVRNAAVNTLFSCIVGQGTTFSDSDWRFCFIDAVFCVYDTVEQRMRATGKPSNPEEKASLRLHHSRDSESKLWLTTLVLVLQGLSRVLRNNFTKLLNSVENETWFSNDVWPRILDISVRAARERGDSSRGSVDIRSVGIELLVLLCQLSSEAGIQAAISPARVGTNMEVVNGALRSVREANAPIGAEDDRSSLPHVEDARLALFASSFDRVESFAQLELPIMDAKNDSDQQILTRFCGHLQRLHDCCSGSEFNFDNRFSSIQHMAGTSEQDQTQSHEGRFVRIVCTILQKCETDMSTRFLNQGQKASVDLLRAMAGNGSFLAFQELVRLSCAAFFLRRDSDTDASEHHDELPSKASLLNFECATAVSEEICKEAVSNECRCYVLSAALSNFLNDHDVRDVRIRRHYKLFLPILREGLLSSSRVATEDDGTLMAINAFWQQVIACAERMLEPISLGRDLVKIQRVPELIEMAELITQNAPSLQGPPLSSVLSAGASAAVAAARQHSVRAESNPESDHGKKSKRHRDELMNLFKTCIEGSCQLNPEETSMHELAARVITEATADANQEASVHSLVTEAAITVCSVIQANSDARQLVVAIFPSLCSVLVSPSSSLRLKDAAGRILTQVNVAQLLEEAHTRIVDAEARAEAAEEEVMTLRANNEELRGENDALQQQVAESKRSLWGLG